MNFQQIVSDLCEVMTLDEVAQSVGLKSRSSVHGIKNGRQDAVVYDVGVKLVALRKRMSRRIYTAKLAKGQS